MKKKVGIIHTSFVSVETLRQLFREIVPDAEIVNIVDDSLLPEVKSVGHITPGIVRRIGKYAQELEAIGCSVILNQCSSVSEAADIVQNSISIPYLKIDRPMGVKAVEAVGESGRIAVVATVKSTMGPSVRLVERTAREMGKDVEVVPYLVDGAMDVLIYQGDQKRHNEMVRDTVEKAARECGAVVLAQGSMIVLLDELKHIQTPLFSSPRLGVESVKAELERLQALEER